MPAWRRVSAEAMITDTPGRAARIFGNAVIPSITGISTSSRITSGASAASSDSAASPFAAAPTTLIAGSAPIPRVITSRITAESSTTKTPTGASTRVDLSG